MAKFYGNIGFATFQETAPGVVEEVITDHPYFGDFLGSSRRIQTTSNLNDDIDLSNKISIVADPFAFENFLYMKYVELGGGKWKVVEVEVEYPRLILTIRGVYNG